MRSRKIILFVVNVDWFFISHRLEIARQALRDGYEVHLATTFTDRYEFLLQMGLVLHSVNFARNKNSFYSEISTVKSLYKVIKITNPDVVHFVTIKPVLYGGLILRLLKPVPAVFAVTGLGLVFVADGFVAKVRKFFVKLLYKIAFAQPRLIVIFQNANDKTVLQKHIKLGDKNCRFIKGSGADLNLYRYIPESDKQDPVVVMASRLLKEKGVYEYIAAAKILKQKNIAATFWLVGEPDFGNPNSILRKELEEWRGSSEVDILGFSSDIPAVFSKANIVVLPSYYGEGVPKVLIEAAACGRAIVTTDNPGCAEAVIDHKTGLVVPAKNSQALAAAIEMLALDPELRKNMGLAAREFAEQEFDVVGVVEKHMDIYKELCNGN